MDGWDWGFGNRKSSTSRHSSVGGNDVLFDVTTALFPFPSCALSTRQRTITNIASIEHAIEANASHSRVRLGVRLFKAVA